MRRNDREITDPALILDIINECKVCRIGLADGDMPYVVPLNFGYTFEQGTGALTLFLHGAKEGKKADIIQKNNRACFEMDTGGVLIPHDRACANSFAYKSIIGFGRIILLENDDEKTAGLEQLMRHQTGKTSFHFEKAMLNKTAVYRLTADNFTAKSRQ